MRDIPYASLERLCIDIDQLEILMNENIDLPSTLGYIELLGPQGSLNNLMVLQFLENYHFRHEPTIYDNRHQTVREPRDGWVRYHLIRV